MPFTTRLIRKLGPSERGKVRDHLMRLSPEDRRMRFFGAVGAAYVAAYCETLCSPNNITLGCFADGLLCAVGELHLEGKSAEAAITVECGYQNSGIGTELLRRLLELARNRFIANLHLTCLADNHRVQTITRKSGAVLSHASGTIGADITPPAFTLWSLFTEIIADQQGMWSILLANDTLANDTLANDSGATAPPRELAA